MERYGKIYQARAMIDAQSDLPNRQREVTLVQTDLTRVQRDVMCEQGGLMHWQREWMR